MSLQNKSQRSIFDEDFQNCPPKNRSPISTWSSEVCKYQNDPAHTHTETLKGKSHRKPQTNLKKKHGSSMHYKHASSLFFATPTQFCLQHTALLQYDLKLYKNERKPDIYKNLSVQTSFFYTTLLKYPKGMHTNKLWYVKKTTHFSQQKRLFTRGRTDSSLAFQYSLHLNNKTC